MNEQLFFDFYYLMPLTNRLGQLGTEYGLTHTFIVWN